MIEITPPVTEYEHFKLIGELTVSYAHLKAMVLNSENPAQELRDKQDAYLETLKHWTKVTCDKYGVVPMEECPINSDRVESIDLYWPRNMPIHSMLLAPPPPLGKVYYWQWFNHWASYQIEQTEKRLRLFAA